VYRAIKRFFGGGGVSEEWFDAEAEFPEQIAELRYRDRADRDEAARMAMYR
jgi:hypothetical protein